MVPSFEVCSGREAWRYADGRGVDYCDYSLHAEFTATTTALLLSVLSFSTVTKSISKTRFSNTSVNDDCFIKLA